MIRSHHKVSAPYFVLSIGPGSLEADIRKLIVTLNDRAS